MHRSPLAVLVVVVSTAPVAGVARGDCAIGAFDPETSVFFLDLDGDGVWDGTAGGDATSEVATFAGPGVPLVGDWNGDGVDETGKMVGTRFFLDLDGDRDWSGNAGGDRNTSFAADFGEGIPVVGDWNGDGRDEIGVFVGGRFLLDRNGNGSWDGQLGGDRNLFLGGSSPLVGDWNGDGIDDVAAHLEDIVRFDRNGDGIWSGAAGGDAAIRFVVQPVVGDWLGIGRSSIGTFDSLASRFLLDGDAGFQLNWVDLSGSVGAFTGVGTPLVCDWDGDGDTDLGKVLPNGRFVLDTNGNRRWDGVPLGDRSTLFDVGAPATPVAGRWVGP